MNDTVLIQLKILVETAVRPVRAGARRKRRMREELLAHVMAVFEKEARKTGDENRALERTRERFGNTADLTDQLQQSVPWFGLIPRIIEDLRNRFPLRPGESRWRCALRQIFWMHVYFGTITFLGLAFLVLVLSAGAWAIGIPSSEIATLLMHLLVTLGSLLGFLLVVLSAMILLGHGLWDALYGPSGISWTRTVLILLASSVFGMSMAIAPSLRDLLDNGPLTFARSFAEAPAYAVFIPIVLLFLTDLRSRQLNTPGRSWQRSLAIDAGWCFVTSALMFMPTLLITGEIAKALPSLVCPVGHFAMYFIPWDLALTLPENVAIYRWDRDWANLQIN